MSYQRVFLQCFAIARMTAADLRYVPSARLPDLTASPKHVRFPKSGAIPPLGESSYTWRSVFSRLAVDVVEDEDRHRVLPQRQLQSELAIDGFEERQTRLAANPPGRCRTPAG